VPVTVTFVPTGPLVGVNDEIVGAGGGATVTAKAFAVVAVPPGVVTAISPVEAPAGTIAVSDVADATVKDALVPPKVTLVVPVKFVPVTVTFVPTGPLVGVNDEMVGAGTVTVNGVALVAVPPGVVTAIGPVVAPFGTVAWSAVSETTVNDALVPPKVTFVVPVKLAPPIVTLTPTGPLVGAKDEIVGAGGVTLKAVALVAVPPGAVTAIGPVDAPVGTVAETDVSDETVKDALVPPNLTLVAPVKALPVIVTFVPTGPPAGLNDVIVGAGGGVVEPGVTPKSHVRHEVDDVSPPAIAYWLPSHTLPTLPPPAAGSGLAPE
jgi:hypothetical protein